MKIKFVFSSSLSTTTSLQWNECHFPPSLPFSHSLCAVVSLYICCSELSFNVIVFPLLSSVRTYFEYNIFRLVSSVFHSFLMKFFFCILYARNRVSRIREEKNANKIYKRKRSKRNGKTTKVAATTMAIAIISTETVSIKCHMVEIAMKWKWNVYIL